MNEKSSQTTFNSSIVSSFSSNFPMIALAPMDGVTDYPYRTMIQSYSPIVNTFFTEFVPVQGFFSRPELFIPKLLFEHSDNKINILQVFGKASQDEYFKNYSRSQICRF